MNYTETQLKAIKIFGKKDLTEGCSVICSDGILRTIVDYCELTIQTNGGPEFNYKGMSNESEDIGIIEILGHTPHLEDLFRIATEKGFIYILQNISLSRYELGFNNGDKKTYIEYKPSLPLLDQPSLPEIISLFR